MPSRFKVWMERRSRVVAFFALALFMMVFCAILFSARRLTPLTATLRTRSISFEIGDWPDSAGLFASDAVPVDLTFQGRFRVVSGDSPSGNDPLKRDLTLHNVKLHWLDSAQRLDVTLDVYDDGALHIDLTRHSFSKANFASVLLDGKSEVVDPGLNRLVPKTGIAEWSIRPDTDNALGLTVRFLDKNRLPAPEKYVALEVGKNVLFERSGRPAIVGQHNELNVQEPDRRLPLDNGDLKLNRLQSGELITLGLHMQPRTNIIDWLDVTLAGQSDDIQVIRTGDVSQIAEVLPWPISSGVISAVSAASTVLGAIFTMIYALLYWRRGPEARRGWMGREPEKAQDGGKGKVVPISREANTGRKGS
jgi:hypothetical protein